MEFIIAIVLFAYWAIRIGADSAGTKRAEKEIATRQASIEKWNQRVSFSKEEESKLNEDIISPTRYGILEKRALKTIRSFHGLEYACFEAKDRKYGATYIRCMIKFIEAVKRGKLPALQREVVPSLDAVLDLHVSRTARVQFALWVEETMQENGVPEARLYARERGGYIECAWEPFHKLGCSHDYITKRPLTNIRVTDPSWPDKMTGGYSDELCAELNAPLIERNKARREYFETFNKSPK